MAQGFKSTPRGITAKFSAEEASLLRQLFADVALALEPEESQISAEDPLAQLVGISAEAKIPQDPAVARMLPEASDDPEVADEYRRYTEHSLRIQKIANLQLAQMDAESEQILLNAEHAQAWATALNDVRLTLGERLEIHSEEDAQRVEQYYDATQIDSVQEYMSLVYNFVTWLQDTLMNAMILDLD